MIFTPQQFALLQSLINEMYQSDQTRSVYGVLFTLRPKFLVQGNVTLTEPERSFLLDVLIDVNLTSRSPLIQSQYGVQMKFQSPTPLDNPRQSQTQLSSSTSQISNRFQNSTFSSSTLQGSYLQMWYVLQQCMALLGKAPTPPNPVEPAVGPTGDPNSVSTGRPNVDPDNRILDPMQTLLTG